MSDYKLLHEADGLEEQVAKKYNVPTYQQYCADSSCTNNLSEFQSLVFTLVYFMHCFKEKPHALVINREKALGLLEEKGEIPKELEGVQIAFHEDQIFKQTCLA